jgi:hypothetical protein
MALQTIPLQKQQRFPHVVAFLQNRIAALETALLETVKMKSLLSENEEISSLVLQYRIDSMHIELARDREQLNEVIF